MPPRKKDISGLEGSKSYHKIIHPFWVVFPQILHSMKLFHRLAKMFQRRQNWRKRVYQYMRMHNQAKLAAESHRGQMAEHMSKCIKWSVTAKPAGLQLPFFLGGGAQWSSRRGCQLRDCVAVDQPIFPGTGKEASIWSILRMRHDKRLTVQGLCQSWAKVFVCTRHDFAKTLFSETFFTTVLCKLCRCDDWVLVFESYC